ncbi:hypothetical protein D3C80_1745750 [compost metagenome]
MAPVLSRVISLRVPVPVARLTLCLASRCGRLAIRLTMPPGGMLPYSTEVGPLNTSSCSMATGSIWGCRFHSLYCSSRPS